MNCFQKIISVLFLFFALNASAQVLNKSWRSITEIPDGTWFASDEAIQVAENVLLYQRNIGAERRNEYSWYTNEPKEVLKGYDKWKKKL